MKTAELQGWEVDDQNRRVGTRKVDVTLSSPVALEGREQRVIIRLEDVGAVEVLAVDLTHGLATVKGQIFG